MSTGLQQSWPITSLGLVLDGDTGRCADHAIAAILELPNQAATATDADGPDCIFGARLTIDAGPKRFEIAAECGDWANNIATCWGFDQNGEFRLGRDREKAPTQFRLVFPGPAKPAAPGPAAAEAGSPDKDTAAQRHGLFLDTLVDDKKEAKGDLWMVWTGATVEVEYTR